MLDDAAELFDLIADGYDEDVPFYAVLGRRLVAWADPAVDATVLDIGAGRGAITRALVEAGRATGGIVAGDVSPRMVEHLAALRLPGVQVRGLDALALDLGSASFDAVFAGYLLSALPDPAPAVAEFARVLRPGGQLLLSAPGPSPRADGWWQRYGEIVEVFCRRLADDLAAEGVAAADEPVECTAHGADAAEHIGLRPVDHALVEVDLPIDGPDAYWRWLQGHGTRWLSDALGEADRDEFRRQVLDSLRDHHPAGGRRLIAGAVFERWVRC